MDQEQKFLEAIEELKLLAQAQGNTLTVDDVKKLFTEEDMELSDEQYTLVVDYLKSAAIEVTENSDGADGGDKAETGEEKDAEFFAMYKRDLRKVRSYTEEEIAELLIDIDKNRNQLTEAYLKDVIKWIEPYKESSVYVCDLVQEGNMGLMEGLDTFEGSTVQELKKHLKKCVEESAMAAICEQDCEDEVSMKVLSRVNAVNDSAKTLSEKLGRKIKADELAKEMNMTMDELNEIHELSGYKIESVNWN